MAVVWIPSLLRGLTGGLDKVAVPGSTLRQVIRALGEQYPDLTERLLDEEGSIQPDLAVAIDGETSHLGLLEKVREDSEIHFIPAIGGGSA